MEISAGAEQLDVNQQLQMLMEQALVLPEARDEISGKRMRLDVVGQNCRLALDGDPDAVVVGRTFAGPGTPESTFIRARIDPHADRDEGNYFEVRYIKGGSPNVYIKNGKQMHRTVYKEEEKDLRLQLALLTLDRAITETNERRSYRQDNMIPEIVWKDDVKEGRIRKLGRSIMGWLKQR